jgi:hypothetical protein
MRKSFKKGDVIEGNIIPNTLNSEPPNFIETAGGIRIDYGGRGGSVVAPLAGGRQGEAPPPSGQPDGFEMGLYRLGVGIGGVVGVGLGLLIAKGAKKSLAGGALIGGVAMSGAVILYNVKFGYKFGKIVSPI